MRKYTLLLLIAVGTLNTWAAQRSEVTARQEAARFILRTATAKGMPAQTDLRLVGTPSMPKLDLPAMYIYQNGNNGYVIVSARDEMEPILAYSNTGTFPIDDMPTNLQWWLGYYAEQAEALEQYPDLYTVHHTERTYQAVDTLITCWWGQDEPFNLKCPNDADGERSVTGCVATAAAQIMYHHQWPDKGEGSHSYQWSNSQGESRTLTANFGQTTYRWKSMQDHYVGDYPQPAATAVATLMSHAGISCDMHYTSYGSGAYSPLMLYALHHYFLYERSMRIVYLDYYRDSSFMNLIEHELNHNRPLYMGGATKNNEGHAFVLDGIDEEGNLHINWGWNGKANGYYQLRKLDPKEQGTGGSSMGYAFTYQVEIVTGIRPNQGWDQSTTIICDGLYTTKGEAKRNQDVTIYTDALQNGGCDYEWEGRFGLLLYQDDKVIKVLEESDKQTMELYSANYSGISFTHRFNDADLTPGTYRLGVGARYEDAEDWYGLLYENLGELRWDLIVTEDSVFLEVNYNDAPIVEREAEPTSVDAVESNTSTGVCKQIRNGELMIRRDDQWYDVWGNIR